jgi:hypothetical protein
MTLNQYQALVKKAVQEDIKNGVAKKMFRENYQEKNKTTRHSYILNDLINSNREKVWNELDLDKKLDLVFRTSVGYPPLDNDRRFKLVEIIKKNLKGEM